MRARTALVLLLCCSACTFLPGRGGRRHYRTTVESLLLDPRAPRYLVCGHRGALFGSILGDGYNTISSFREAVAEGADLVEVDVQATADLVPVISHEDGVCERPLPSHDGPGSAPLTLRETLEWARGRTVLVLDLKTRHVDRVVREVTSAGATECVLFYAHKREEYEAVRAASEEAWVMVRARSREDVAAWLTEDDPRVAAVHGDANWLQPEIVAEIRRTGRRVFANSYRATWHQELFGAEASAARLFETGIDIAQTNRPAGACRARDRFLAREAE
jgi:hypothetical protein